MAYGQTGGGKTYTMFGPAQPTAASGPTPEESRWSSESRTATPRPDQGRRQELNLNARGISDHGQ
eukprot:10672503-Alexandrium_andersonii.AAC.1